MGLSTSLSKFGSRFLGYALKSVDNLTASRRAQDIFFVSYEEPSSSDTVLFYVHYSKNDTLSENEISSLKKLRDLGLHTCLVFNSNSDKNELNFEAFEKYKEIVSAVLVRKNNGYDLGAYRDAYKLYQKNNSKNSGSYIFMNNSVIWIPELITDYFAKWMATDSDIVGSSISHQHNIHLQTFLFGCRTVAGKEIIEKWLHGIRNWRFKSTIVGMGELETRQFFNKKLEVTSLPGFAQLISLATKKIHDLDLVLELSPKTYSRLISNRKFHMAQIALNPTHHYWLEMLELGFPGIKLDLVSRNPADIEDYDLIIRKLLNFGVSYEDLVKIEIMNANKQKSKINRLISIFR